MNRPAKAARNHLQDDKELTKGCQPGQESSGTSDASPRKWRKFDPDTYSNPDGHIPDFGYDILRRSYRGRELSAVDLLRRKLRHPDGPLGHFHPHRDVVTTALLLPPPCPDLFADPDVLWFRLDSDHIANDQHLLAGPTIWFPRLSSQHGAIRRVQEFAQKRIVDRYSVAGQLIAHAPHRICLGGDFHIHVLFSARSIGPSGFGPFVPEILRPGCQMEMHASWDNWKA